MAISAKFSFVVTVGIVIKEDNFDILSWKVGFCIMNTVRGHSFYPIIIRRHA